MANYIKTETEAEETEAEETEAPSTTAMAIRQSNNLALK